MGEEKSNRLPGIGCIKIIAGSPLKMGDMDLRFPTDPLMASIVDADTGQPLCFVSGIEIISRVNEHPIVKLIVEDTCFELDYYVKQNRVPYPQQEDEPISNAEVR